MLANIREMRKHCLEKGGLRFCLPFSVNSGRQFSLFQLKKVIDKRLSVPKLKPSQEFATMKLELANVSHR